MGLRDLIKSRKDHKHDHHDHKHGDNVLDMVNEPKTEKMEKTALKENTGFAHRILKSHHLSEKTNLLAAAGRYVFKVATNANKIEVKKAIRLLIEEGESLTKVKFIILLN